MALVRPAHVHRALSAAAARIYAQRHDLIAQCAEKLRRSGVLPPPGPVVRWGQYTVMLRACPVCDSNEIHSALVNEKKAENAVATGVRFVCGKCGHEGPSAEMASVGLQDRTRLMSAVLWNDYDKHPSGAALVWPD